MKKLKLLFVPMLLTSSLVTIPTTASADPYANCFLMAGCAYDNARGIWLCPDPLTYADCYMPADG